MPGRRRDDTETPDPDRDTLPAEVIDIVPAEYEGYDIVATALDKESNLWDFRVKARQGVNNNLTFDWEFGDGEVYTGVDQSFSFASSGGHAITVTARETNGKIAFVLSLQIEIVAGNQPPVSDAGADQAVGENQLVFLYGGGSFDPDDSNLSYRWSQLSGPPVQLLDKASPTARFVTPFVSSETRFDFDLTVDDGELVGKDAAGVTVLDTITIAETGPAANAGPDQQVSVGDLVTLNAGASVGAPGMTYHWRQTAGATAVLANAIASSTTFIAPSVTGASERLVFELIVTENDLSDVDEVAVTVDAPDAQSCDLDTDGDGTADCVDECPEDPNKTAPGACGCGTADADSDDDGVPDCTDQCPGEVDADADGDGTVNCLDNCPDDSGKTEPGVCGCGIADTDSDGNGILDCAEQCPPGSGGDDDGDGVANCLDECPNDAAKTAPLQCGCGVPDVDSDGDSVPDCMDVCPQEPDVDADADGVMNCDDACPNDPTKTQVGICGCGVADVDSDDDGTLDCEDNCPTDADKLEPGACGCGLADTDADGNGVADCNESAGGNTLLEDFSGYAVGADPTGWLDTGANNSTIEDDTLFEVIDVGGPVFGTASTETNIHSHFVAGGSERWTDYSYSGRIRRSANGSLGVTFLSDYPNSDKYYRLRSLGGSFHIDPHGTSISGGTTDSGVAPAANQWYRFSVDVKNTGSRTEIRAKVWAAGSTEPSQWQIDCYDASVYRLSVGTVGLWSMGSGGKFWDDLVVTALSCDTDADRDGVLDCNDGCPNDPDKTAPGTCGCAIPDTDSDADGVADCEDQCPGQPDADSDNDGVADCVDACPGFDDALDSNGNGVPDGCEAPTLSVSTTSLSFAPTASSATFQVWNSGGGSLSYTVVDDAGWLSASPNGGTSTGERDTITAFVDRAGLADGTYEGEITVTPSAGTVATILVSITVGTAEGMPMTAASRTSGVAPLAVFFDAVDVDGWGSRVVQPPIVDGRREYADYHYQWDFSDPNSGTWPGSGLSRNKATGYVAAHVFENPGTYSVTLNVISTTACTSDTNCPGGSCDTRFNLCAYDYTQDVHVLAFSGKTYYVSSSQGSDANSGLSESAPFQTFDKAMSMLASNVSILFKRGDTFSTSTGVTIGVPGPGIIGAYGSCSSPDELGICANNPLVNVASGVHAFGLTGSTTPRDWRISNLKLSASASSGDAIRAWGTQRDWLVHKLDISGFTNGILLLAWFSNSPDGSAYNLATMHDRVTISSTRIQYTENKSFMGPCRRLAVLGCRFTDSATSHILRISHGPKAVVTGNTLGRAGNGLHAFKMHSGPASSYPDSNYFTVSGNTFLAGGVWPVALGPQDDRSDERISDGVIEANTFHTYPETQVNLRIWARYVTIRNNIFLGDGGGAWQTAVNIGQRGVEPPPVGCRILNNTFYRGDAATGYWAINVSSVASGTVIRNNAVSTPLIGNLTLVKSSGTGGTSDHNMVVPATAFRNPASKDFYPAPGSVLIDAGADTGVLFDYSARPRKDDPQTQNVGAGAHPYLDIGAFEFAP